MINSIPGNLSFVIILGKADIKQWKIRKTSIFQEILLLKVTLL